MKKGFTLVELLAVIIVLGVISMITVSVVTNNISQTKEKTFEVNVMSLLEAAKEYVTKEMENNDFPEEGIEAQKLNLKNNPFISGIVKRNEAGQIELENVTDGNYCVNGIKSDLEITKGGCETLDDTAPTLKLKELKTTRSTTEIMIKTQDSGSGIEYYEYCVNGKCERKEKSETKSIIKEVIKIDELEADKEYKIKVKSVNSNDQETKQEIVIKTKEIEEPVFEISSNTYATIKKIKIIYPELEEGYEKKYKIGEEIKEVKEKEIEIEIETNDKIKAYVEKEGKEIVSNEIIINGIDLEGPKVNILIPEIDKWTKTKKMTIEATDEDIGLAIRPYSYDSGKNFEKVKEKELNTSRELNIKVRDRLGNINKKFTINGTIECCVDCNELCVINKVDSVEPKIDIVVKQGTKIQNEKYSDWYNSEKVVVEIKIEDYYLYNEEKIQGGSGVKEESIKVKVNGKEETPTKIETNKYQIEISESRENKIEVEVEDKVGNKGTKSKVVKIDNKIPVISVKSNPLSLGSGNYNFVDNLKVTYGPTGGNATCNPASSLKTGTYTVTCKATGNNGKVANAGTGITFTARHNYPAEPYTSTCTQAYSDTCTRKINCKEKKKCWTVGYHWCEESSENCGGNCHGSTSLCPDVECDGTYMDCDTEEYSCTKYRDEACTKYRCPNGGNLKGTTCYY